MVDRLDLNPFWQLLIRLFFSLCSKRGFCINCSRIFPGSWRREIRLRSLGLVAFVTLGIGITVAVFQSFGYFPVLKMRLKSFVNTGVKFK